MDGQEGRASIHSIGVIMTSNHFMAHNLEFATCKICMCI